MEKLIPNRLEIASISEQLQPVLDYWRSLCPASAVGPAWTDFDLIEIPAPLLPAALVVDVEEDTGDLLYRYFGTQFAEVFGADRTGKRFSELSDFYVEASRTTYGWVMDEMEPVLLAFAYLSQRTPIQIMEILRLPLSNNGEAVTNIVSVAGFSSDRRQLSRMLDGDGAD